MSAGMAKAASSGADEGAETRKQMLLTNFGFVSSLTLNPFLFWV
jgi:hypothetical protein